MFAILTRKHGEPWDEGASQIQDLETARWLRGNFAEHGYEAQIVDDRGRAIEAAAAATAQKADGLGEPTIRGAGIEVW